MKLTALIFGLIIHVSCFASEESATTLEELLKEVKENRLANQLEVKVNISEGISWINGLYFNGRVLPCNDMKLFRVAENENRTRLDEGKRKYYVELTVNVKNSGTNFAEVVNIHAMYDSDDFEGCHY